MNNQQCTVYTIGYTRKDISTKCMETHHKN